MNNEQELMQQFERECATAMEKIDGPQWNAKVQSDDSQYFFYAARIAYAAWNIGRASAASAGEGAQADPFQKIHERASKALSVKHAKCVEKGYDGIDHALDTLFALKLGPRAVDKATPSSSAQEGGEGVPVKVKALGRQKVIEWASRRHDASTKYLGASVFSHFIADIKHGDFDFDQGGDA